MAPKRSGHLFRNRYKSIVCEEDPYLLELIRYIHLNPLRAGLVKDLKELDIYPWTGHSAILGKRKNSLIPHPVKSHQQSAISSSDISQKPMVEKTIEDVLLNFGEILKVARRRYRQFVKNGIKQGVRPDLQGGGLVRSAGGDKTGLLGRRKGERELGDERILGGSSFVERVISNLHRIECPKIVSKIPLPELVDRISKFLGTEKDEVLFGNQKRINCHARNLICLIAVKSMGYKFNELADTLKIYPVKCVAYLTGVHPVTAGRCAEKGKKVVDNYEKIWDILKECS